MLLKQYNTVRVHQLRLPVDYRADPKYWNYTWMPWVDIYDSYAYNAGAAIGTVAVCAHIALLAVIMWLRFFIWLHEHPLTDNHFNFCKKCCGGKINDNENDGDDREEETSVTDANNARSSLDDERPTVWVDGIRIFFFFFSYR